MTGRRTIISTLCALVLSVAGRALAQTPANRGLNAPETIEEQKSPFVLRMAAGFSGAPDRIRAERWFPVNVDCRNHSDKDIEAVVTLVWFTNGSEATDLSYTRKVSLPKHSRKGLRFVVLDKRESGVLVARLESEGAVLVSQSTALFREYDDRSAILVVTDRTGRFSFLLPPQNSEKVDPMPPVVQRDIWEEEPERLPEEWAAYEGCDAVVLDNISLAGLTELQRAALRDYCLMGGRLVAMYGSSARSLALEGRGLAALLPVTLDGSTSSIDARVFASRFGGEIRPEGQPGPVASPKAEQGLVPLLVAAAKARPEATVSLEAGGLPLVAWQDRGLGRAVFCAFAMGEAPFRSWPQRSELMNEVLGWGRLGVLTPTAPAPGSSINPYIAPTFTHTRNTAAIWAQMAEVTNRDAIIKPLAWELAGLFLLAYVLAIGPLTYFVFRLFKRTEFAWLMTPVTIVGFALAVQYLGRGEGTRNVSAQAYTLVEAGSGAPTGRATSMISLYTPSRGEYTLTFGSGRDSTPAYPSPVPGAQLGRGLTRRAFTVDASAGAPRLVDFEMLPRSSRVLRIEQPLRMEKGVMVEVAADKAGPRDSLRVTGRVVNGTRWPLTHPTLVFDGRIVAHADLLPAGETLSVETALPWELPAWGAELYSGQGSIRLCAGQPLPALPETGGPGGLFAQIIGNTIRTWPPARRSGVVFLAELPSSATGLALDGDAVRLDGRTILCVTGGRVLQNTPLLVGDGGWEFRIRRASREHGGISWIDGAGTLRVVDGAAEVEIEALCAVPLSNPAADWQTRGQLRSIFPTPPLSSGTPLLSLWSDEENSWSRRGSTPDRQGVNCELPSLVHSQGRVLLRLGLPEPGGRSSGNAYYYGYDPAYNVALQPRACFWKK